MAVYSLDESERATLTNALHVAAEQYKRDAATVHAEGAAEHARLAHQFSAQASQAKALAIAIENTSEVLLV